MRWWLLELVETSRYDLTLALCSLSRVSESVMQIAGFQA